MPIYRFKCEKCGVDFEDLVMKRGDKSSCPECGSRNVEKQITAPSPHQSKDGPSTLPCADGSCDIAPSCGCMGGMCPHG